MKSMYRLAGLGAALAFAPAAFATNGYFSHGYGMKAKGMAGAGIAYSQDALAAATNPAGMVLVGNRVDFGLDVFAPDRSAKVSGTPGGMFDGNYDGNETANFFIPEFGYNRMLNDRMSVGVSVFGNGGMNTDYDKEFMLFSGGSGKKPGVDLSQLFITPAFAMKVNDQHAIGVGLNLIYQRFKADGLEGFTGLEADGTQGDLTGNGYDTSTGYSLRLGWVGQVTPQLSIGATYQSRGEMSSFDDYSDLFAEQGDFDIPETYGIGLAFAASEKLTVAFDVQKINYSSVKSIANPLTPAILNCVGSLMGGGGPTSECLGGSKGPGFGWEDMTVYKLGVAYQYRPDLVLRAGWNHGDQPIPDSETLFNFLAPATVENHLTLGATWTLQNGSELTVAYMHAFENEVKGSDSIPAGFGGGEVDLKMSQNSLGVGYGWKF